MNIEHLVPKLLDITQKKKISWTEAAAHTLIARIGGMKFQISAGFDDDREEPFYRFNLYESDNAIPYDGRFLDSVYADRFRGIYADLEELYTAARRNALGLDKVIAEIDVELDKLL